MRDMCLKESGLCVQHLFIILGSRVNLGQGDLCSLLVARYKWTLTIHLKIEYIPKRIWGLISPSSITFQTHKNLNLANLSLITKCNQVRAIYLVPCLFSFKFGDYAQVLMPRLI